MSPSALGILWAAVFAVPVSLLSKVRPPIRPRRRSPSRSLSGRGAVRLPAVNLVLLYGIDSLTFYFGRPMMTFVGLVPLILVNLAVLASPPRSPPSGG